jgi:hypothetical protein
MTTPFSWGTARQMHWAVQSLLLLLETVNQTNPAGMPDGTHSADVP